MGATPEEVQHVPEKVQQVLRQAPDASRITPAPGEQNGEAVTLAQKIACETWATSRPETQVWSRTNGHAWSTSYVLLSSQSGSQNQSMSWGSSRSWSWEGLPA